ncbi:cupin domain-containing protein [Mucilaginibacter agri]|uniref:Cupin domain-containing protein n=1 Tax=Mucilaginibacter agri TaxID=2695265 RepID=A0A965ZH35_9SPHI|nr:cupin domain-containing protein [Mucilaginibacter agri]NCD70954.1 cupin domain-containing protein [Mucilaginibacter agri]
MKRNSFLRSCFALGAIVVAPISGIAEIVKRFRVNNGFSVDAGKSRTDKTITLFEGDTFFPKVATKDTDGDIYVFESSRVKEGGPAHHYHFTQDEWWYVLQGEFLIRIGDTTYHAKAGDSVFGPRMIPHSFAKIGDGEGKLLQFFQPAGKMEEFFSKVSEGALKDLTLEQQDKFREEYGFKRVGPAIKYEKKL